MVETRIPNPAQSLLLREDPEVRKSLATYVLPNDCGERYTFCVTTNNRITLDKRTALPIDIIGPEDLSRLAQSKKSSLFKNIGKNLVNNLRQNTMIARLLGNSKQQEMDRILETGMGYCFVSHEDIFVFLKRGRLTEPCGFLPENTIGARMGTETMAIFQKIGLKNGLCQKTVESLTGEEIIPTPRNSELLLQEAMSHKTAAEVFEMMSKNLKPSAGKNPLPPRCLKCSRKKCTGYDK